ncbi:hypothetical protein [Polaromonas sp. JS666]|uniref:hypothetical protein n=1 Tax=Polaromonas sp. (strain JS666 / ATCC BAA-500) TaxID=296591 RepID=UPI0000464734|nr:hypothetical protein [Polaromonas sp. JS666]ABE47353.1 hypothetical protein Bpro_5499 [Polaromonas sp. JS666]
MINVIVMEGDLTEKPVLLEGKKGVVCEFNLSHSVLTGDAPSRSMWRCRAEGALAESIAERGAKAQRVTIKGTLVQELVNAGEQQLAVVKILVQDVSFGQVKRP